MLDRLPVAVFLFDKSGRIIGRAGQISGFVGEVIPSLDLKQAGRWRFEDPAGSLIPRNLWPSARALRGEIDYNGLIGRLQMDGERLIKVVSVPVQPPDSEVTAMTFMLETDIARRSIEGSHSDLEHRLIHALVRAVAEAPII